MGKEKFVYNQQTLRYEKVQITLRGKILRTAVVGGIIAAYTALVLAFAPELLSSASVASFLQQRELDFVKTKYEELNKQLDVMGEALVNVQDRDAALYRQVLQMEPIDDYIWKGGRGGSEKHPELKNLSDSELLVKAAERIAQMRHQIAISTKSQDQILNQAKKSEDIANSRPSIRPIGRLDRKIQLLSGFGYRVHPIYKVRKMHTGIDFGAPTGTPIYSTANGKVVKVEYKPTGYGKCVVIDHGNGIQTLYGHMSQVGVSAGQEVRKGEEIGKVGSTGTSTSPHVHYEVIKNGEKVNPVPFCMDDLTPEEYKNFVSSSENQTLLID